MLQDGVNSKGTSKKHQTYLQYNVSWGIRPHVIIEIKLMKNSQLNIQPTDTDTPPSRCEHHYLLLRKGKARKRKLQVWIFFWHK